MQAPIDRAHRGCLSRLTLRCVLVLAVTALPASRAMAQRPPRIARSDSRTANSFDDNRFRYELERDLGRNRSMDDFDDLPQNYDLSGLDIREVRQVLDRFSNDVQQMHSDLKNEARQNRNLRYFDGDLSRLRARIWYVADLARTTNDLRRVASEYQGIDREWRTLAHQLGRVNGVSRVLLSNISSINQLDSRLGDLFHLSPQLNHREIISQLAAMDADMNNLIDEIELELGRSKSRRYTSEVRRLQQQARFLEGTVSDRDEYNEIVREFNAFREPWYQLAAQLRSVRVRDIDRSARNVTSALHSIEQLLWVTGQSDRTHLLHLTQSLMRDVDEFYGRTPLRMLLQLPDSQYALNTATEFYGMCENFEDSVKNNQNDSGLHDDYGYVAEASSQFLRAFSGLRSQAARAVLKQIEDSMVALREEMQYSGDVVIDPIALGDKLKYLAEHADEDIDIWIKRDRPTFGREVSIAARQFVDGTRDLHSSIERNSSDREIARQAKSLSDQWYQTYMKYLRKANENDSKHFAEISAEIYEALYDLGIVYGTY